jgi:hypothetical protein
MSFQNFDTSNSGGMGYPGGYGGYGGWLGGAGGGAFLGGLAGSFIGDAFFPGARYGRGGCDGNGGERVTQVNVNDRGGYGNIGQWELMKEMSDTRREVAIMPYIAQNTALQQTISMNSQIASLAQQICCCCNETQRLELEGQYKALLTSAGLSREIAECCCKQLQATTVMGYETQLRDQTNMGIVMKEIAEVKCMIKDAEKDGIIRNQAETIDNFRQGSIINTITGRLGLGINQLGVNQVNTAPATSQWPPAIFAPGWL